MTTVSNGRAGSGTGVGLRLPHIQEVVATLPPARWLEIHPENFVANPHGAELLFEARRHYPISVHTVGVSIGSAGGVDHDHLRRVRALVDRLPLPYDKQTLRLLATHIDEVQDGLGRPYVVENPSSYFGFGSSTMSEVEFLSELVARTGCRLLCDVSNVYISAHNMDFDPYRYIDGLPADAIAEIHLGGFSVEPDEANPGADVLIDAHSATVAESVWTLYEHAVRRFGATPTLIEWDHELPSFATLLAEAKRADQVMTRALAAEPLCAAAV
jgi:uncharacterized protein (UPF0276 family)